MNIQELCNALKVYAAKDKDGRAFWYTIKPKIYHYCTSDWLSSNGEFGLVPPNVIFPDVEWDKSLISPQPSIADLAIDQPILVSGTNYPDRSKWFRRHFAGESHGKVTTWCNGTTKWSRSSAKRTTWNYFLLPTEEELK